MIPGRRTGSHSLGLIIYPDGSVSELWDIEGSYLAVLPTKRKPEQLFIVA